MPIALRCQEPFPSPRLLCPPPPLSGGAGGVALMTGQGARAADGLQLDMPACQCHRPRARAPGPAPHQPGGPLPASHGLRTLAAAAKVPSPPCGGSTAYTSDSEERLLTWKHAKVHLFTGVWCSHGLSQQTHVRSSMRGCAGEKAHEPQGANEMKMDAGILT